MLATLLVYAQLAAASPATTYSTPALRAMVAEAVVANHTPPAGFGGYRASVESELALILRDTLGRERPGQVEQVASTVEWKPGRSYLMNIIGYRQQSRGVPMSALSFVRGWTVPSLYGERLVLGASFGSDTTRPAPRDSMAKRDPIVAVHPFAADRDRYYRFTGGDTAAVLHTGRRTVHIVRIRVIPVLRDSTRLAAMDGEVYLDAERGQIVRMRGRFVVLGRGTGPPLAMRMAGVVGVAYMELVNTEVNGEVWLPETQRTEMQSTIALLGASRAVMRVQSRFSGYQPASATASDTTPRTGSGTRVTRWAPADSVDRFRDWTRPLGEMTASVSANDFDDLAPDQWKREGPPVVDFAPTTMENLVRYDRVEGLFTGVEGNVRFRSLAPGVVAGGRVGWAWTERTARGDLHVSLSRGAWTFGGHAGRSLATTNDFMMPDEPQSGGLGAVGGVDDYDYLDRRMAALSLTHTLGSVDGAIVTVQAGAGRDDAEHTRLDHGLIGSTVFRPNRGIRAGSYALGVVDLELHPNVTGESVQSGVGARARLEMGEGALVWRRVELALWARRYLGPVTFDLDASGGALLGSDLVPQALFELGGHNALSGYAYKEFAGDRAVLFRGYAGYALPIWGKPLRPWRSVTIPGVSPGFALSLQGGWTGISSDAARAAVRALGLLDGAPVSRASERVRVSGGAGLTFFSGFMHVGVARPLDVAAPWKAVLGFGRQFWADHPARSELGSASPPSSVWRPRVACWLVG